jgi:O-antigen/teichoic acid export membrane protein
VARRVEKKRSYGKTAKIGVLWGFFREGGNSLLLIPTSMIIARLLTPKEAGVAAAATFFMQLCARVTQVGFGASLVRSKQITAAHVSTVFVVNLGIGVLSWAALTALAPLTGSFLRSPDAAQLLPVAAFGFLIMPFGTVPTALMSRDMRFSESTTSDWIGNITEATSATVLAWHGFSFWSLIYGRLAGDATRAVLRIWMARWRPRLYFSRAALNEMLSFSLGFYAKNILDFGVQNLDNMVVGRTLGMASLGLYDKAFQTAHKFTSKMNLSGPSVSFRIFSLIHEDPERFRRAYRKVMLSTTLVGYPLLSALIVTAPQLILVLFGPKWVEATVPFQILCASNMLKLLNTYASSATQAKGQVWLEVKRQALFVVVLVAAVSGMSRWGITGAAIGVMAATMTMTIMLQMLVKRLSGLNWRDMLEPQLPAVTCAAGMVVVEALTLAVVRVASPTTTPLVLLGACVAAAAIYYLAFLLFVPFAEVRALVHETAVDMAPQVARRLPWLAPSKKESPAFSTS